MLDLVISDAMIQHDFDLNLAALANPDILDGNLVNSVDFDITHLVSHPPPRHENFHPRIFCRVLHFIYTMVANSLTSLQAGDHNAGL